MPADYLSKNVVEVIRIYEEDLAEKQDMDPLLKTIKKILNEEPIQLINKNKFMKPAEKLALDCFIENDLLWARRRYGEQRKVLMVPEDMKTNLLEEYMETCSMVMKDNQKQKKESYNHTG